MKEIYFTSPRIVGEVDSHFTKNDTMFFNFDSKKLTHIPYLQELISITGHGIIDCRLNMLMEGIYPSIPSIHTDLVPRNEMNHIQFEKVETDKIKHYFFINHDRKCEGSKTKFYIPKGNVLIPQINTHYELDKWIRHNLSLFETMHVEDKVIYEFDQCTAHETSPSKNNSVWRLFVRLTKNSFKIPTNEVRCNTNNYVKEEIIY